MGYPYPLAPTQCRGCGKEFTPTDPRQTDCKKGCGRFKRERQTNDWLLANRPHLPTEPCLNCGKPVVQYRMRRKDNELRHCSHACRDKANSLRQLTAAWPPIRAGNCSWVGARCIDCNKVIPNGRRCKAHADARELLLKRLRTRINWLIPKPCVSCGQEFNRFSSGTTCESCKAKSVRQSRALRRARLRGAGAYDAGIDHESVHKRSDGRCALCGGRVSHPSVWLDWDGATWMPTAPTVDHIIPLARGGTHTWSNVQLAHHLCNSKKSDR